MQNPPPNANRLPTLVNLTTNERFSFNGPNVTIGRAPDNVIVVASDGYASGYHARIYFDQGRWLIEDLQSSNGTSVDDQIVNAPFQLSPGNVIKIGRTLFRIE